MKWDGKDIEKLRLKDREAFKALYMETRSRIYSYILYRVNGSVPVAEDILSEVYVSAIDYAGSLTLHHNVMAWLYRIARTKIIDYVRAREKGKKISGALLVNRVTIPPEKSPEELLLLQEQSALVNAAFHSLDDDYRGVMRKKYVEELPVQEIARGLKKTEKAVESMLYRGRRLFAESIARLMKEGRFILKEGGKPE